MTVEYSPFVIEAFYEPMVVDSVYQPMVIEANQSNLVISYEVNEQYQKILVTSNGQTEFHLNYVPTVPANLKVFVQPPGIKMSGSDYSISGSLLTILPTFTVTLEVSEYLEIYYY